MAEEPPRGSYAIKYVCMYVCTYDVIFRNHGNRSSLNLSQNAREG